ncbi:restriction endonuclease [Haloarcula japonica]|uniref:restriction endonuclease n=1 Tax=Haloarcula japonica TaxID=29282 RepID=UPI0039F6DC72
MKEKFLKDDVDWNDLNEGQTEIAEAAIEHPELTHREIGDMTDWSPSYVSTVHQDYLEEEYIPDKITPDNLTDDIYEIIVAGMEAMEEVDRVERHHDLDLNRGDAKEVDVAVWISQGGHDFLVIIECKFHSEPVEQDIPAAMAYYQENSAANQAIIISSSGFQSGAKSLAKEAEVDLYKLDELTQDVGKNQVMRFEGDLTSTFTEKEVIDMDVEPIEKDEEEGEEITINVTSRNELFDENKKPIRKNVHEKFLEISANKSPGTYTEEIDGVLIHEKGHFFHLNSITFKIERLDPVNIGFEFDAYEEYDLYMKDVLKEEEEGETDLDLISIEDAIRTFEEDVR